MEDPIFKESFNTAYAGFGSKQSLVMITDLFITKKDSIIMIEEPEISLHPENIIQLPYLFIDAINQDKKILITTHSHLLILALNKPIYDKLLKKDDIIIYYVDKKPSGSFLTPLEITEQGYIKGGIPTFTEPERKLLNEFLQTTKE
jgi:predicted ATPase